MRPTDPFYAAPISASISTAAIRRVQRAFLDQPHLRPRGHAFGLGLLNDTGSRKSRRQSDLGGDREMSLRQIRAIPHNAILQQLGYPVNRDRRRRHGGGGGMWKALPNCSTLQSARRQIMRMLRAANRAGEHQTGRRLWRAVQFRLLGQPALSRHGAASGGLPVWPNT
jgi:phosphoenolpyruvate carboxylase